MALQPHWDNRAVSSFLLWADHTILTTGQAFTNTASNFYKVSGNISPYTIYAAPYRPFVADKSVPNATVMSGIWLNNSFITTGQSGFVDINYEKGLVYFTGNVIPNPTVSGRYAVKDFTTTLTNRPDERLIFETKHYLKPRVGDTITGLALNDITFPVIYFKSLGGSNTEFAFGGTEKTELTIRAIVLSDSLYSKDAVCGLLKDKARSVIGLFTAAEMPFNSLGGFKNGNYDYVQIVSGKGGQDTIFLEKAKTSVFSQEAFTDLNALNNEVYVSFVDFQICGYRRPRE